uniref:AlNc14C198G8615 protein n=1 Tax=Albugo laibachii Nc14 TaxID=890382 RepID=F0WQE5_9STRA|nr:AlNc14C198G8615 [Albugo laibachii Nc14]|eukprot:CCA23553.1 AlNc14C198G8615 [Albugo laibachii Nc14]
MRADKTIRLAISHDTFAWAANAATTEAAFNDAITKFKQVNTSAVAYFRIISAAKRALYPHFKVIPPYGWRATNFVESEQAKSLRLKPRLVFPFGFFEAYGAILMVEKYFQSKQLKTWAAEEYSTVLSSDDAAFVARITHLLKVPCRHILVALKGQKSPPVISDSVSDCYKVTTFQDTIGSLEIPEAGRGRGASSHAVKADRTVTNCTGVGDVEVEMAIIEPLAAFLKTSSEKIRLVIYDAQVF